MTTGNTEQKLRICVVLVRCGKCKIRRTVGGFSSSLEEGREDEEVGKSVTRDINNNRQREVKHFNITEESPVSEIEL